jgi:hypothetical protein
VKRIAIWAAFVVGLLLVVRFVVAFIEFATIMERFGGIPYSWGLLQNNLGWVIQLAVGLALIAVAAFFLLRQRR